MAAGAVAIAIVAAAAVLPSLAEAAETTLGAAAAQVGQGTANGTQLQIYDCVAAGQANQQWNLVA